MANTATRPSGPTAYDQIETLPPPSSSRNANTSSTATERSALLQGQSGASRDYRTEARRDRARLAGDGGAEGELLERDDEDGEVRRKRPWSLRVDLAVGTLLLLVNGYFWLMSLIAIKSPFVQHTALPAHRGSMFVPVWVSFLSCTINTASLLSFLYPHESPLLSFYTSLTSSFFALVTLILTISVTQLRVIEGPLTFILYALAIVSLLHSALSAALTDKYAPILDPPEELDPDAPEARGFWPKVKRGVRSALGFLGISLPISLAHVAVLVAFVLLFLDIVLRSVDASVEQPGQRWKCDPWLWQRKYFPELGRGLFQSRGREYRIHLSCRGLGLDDPPVLTTSTNTSSFSRPTVRRTILVESDQGVPGSIDAEWVLKMLRDGDLNSGDVETRVCWWDRPGYGFSDGSPSASAPHLVSALTQALTVSGEMARLQPPPSLAASDENEVDSLAAPSPLARSGFVLISRRRSTALTSLFASLHPRLVHSFLYITPSSPSLLYQADAQTRFAAIPHFFTRTIPALWSELGVKRVYWAVKGVPRRRRVLAKEGDGVSGLIERSALLEHHERDRARESDGAKAWERRRGRYPNRPTVVLGKGEGKDEGRRFVEDVVGEGLREWDREWSDGTDERRKKVGKGCGVGGREEEKCREALRGLLSLD